MVLAGMPLTLKTVVANLLQKKKPMKNRLLMIAKPLAQVTVARLDVVVINTNFYHP